MRHMTKFFMAVPLAITMFFTSLLYAQPACAEQDVKEGYDENTEITIKGTVTTISRGAKGPLILRLSTPGRTYEVITAPQWYLDQENISFTPGLELEVTGSKYFGDDGIMYVVGGRVKFVSAEKELRLRDTDFRPLWGRGRGRNR